MQAATVNTLIILCNIIAWGYFSLIIQEQQHSETIETIKEVCK